MELAFIGDDVGLGLTYFALCAVIVTACVIFHPGRR